MNAAVAAALRDPHLPPPVGGSRFDIHRNTFVVSLVDALAESFPVTQALVGVDFFRAMARTLVLAHPPASPVLTEYAFDFPARIADFAPAATVPILADIARIEALRIRAYHAADAAPMPVESFSDLLADPVRLAATRVTLHPACAWLRSPRAAHAVWSAHDVAHTLDAVSLAGIDVDVAQDILVARPAFDLVTVALPSGTATLLDALQAGECFGDAFARATTFAGADPAALLAPLVRHGLIVALHQES
jgi:hypothetical protein